MKHIVVYGSLRAGQYNYQRFSGTQNHLKTITLKDYELYSLGPYPCVCEGEGEIVAELHEVDDTVYSRIRGMELGAGYLP